MLSAERLVPGSRFRILIGRLCLGERGLLWSLFPLTPEAEDEVEDFDEGAAHAEEPGVKEVEQGGVGLDALDEARLEAGGQYDLGFLEAEEESTDTAGDLDLFGGGRVLGEPGFSFGAC